MKELLRKIFRFIFGQKVYVERVTRPYVINIHEQGRFKDKVAVVTGGGGAIGRATACRLAIEGATVIICGRSKATLDIVTDEIKGYGGIADAFACDVMKEDGIASLTEFVVNKYGRIDYWCNIAGGGSRDKMASIDEQDASVFDAVVNTNLTGTLLCCKYAAKQMKKQGCGKN